MNEEMNKQQEAEVKAEAPVETMEDYAAELEASYKAFDERHFELPETDDAEGEKWAEFAQMMADRTVLNVKIAEAVKGGVVAFVNEVRAFIPASQLSTEYVEKLEDWQGKHVDAVIITVDPEKKIFQILRSIYHGIHPFWKIPLIPDCSVRRTPLIPLSFHKTV